MSEVPWLITVILLVLTQVMHMIDLRNLRQEVRDWAEMTTPRIEIDPDDVIGRVYHRTEKLCRRGCCDHYSKPCDHHTVLLNGVELGTAMTLRDLLGTTEEATHG